MPSKNTLLDMTIHEGWLKTKMPKSEPAFGVEVELENCIPSNAYGSPVINYWTIKHEQSLRNNGQEFVTGAVPFTERAVAMKELPKAIKSWFTSKPQLTLRCSTHIHINVQYLTLRQVIHTALAWYLIENLVIRTQTDWRQGNLFCLRMADAEAIGDNIIRGIANPGLFNKYHTKNSVKYAALNLAPVFQNNPTMGTMEWRFLSPITDPALLIFWVEIFQALVEYGMGMGSPDKLLQDYNTLNIKQLFCLIFGKTNGTFLYSMVEERYSSYEAMTRAIHKNYDIIFEISSVLKKQKFELPPYYWYPDDGSPNKTDAEDAVMTWHPEFDEVSDEVLASEPSEV